ncbi:MAG: ATP-binding protein [Candidatus Manganitrophus sp. SA1]|nr:ATP-binding protein [Candidatus Manganitrophus morganii]
MATSKPRYKFRPHPIGDDLINCIELPILVINRDHSVTGFNPAAAAILSLAPSDVGRPLRDVPMLAEVNDLEALCELVMNGRASFHREVQNGAGSWFSLGIGPYKGSDQKISGAVLTLTNVTAFRASLEQAIAEREYTKAIINTVIYPLVVLDEEFRVQAANQAFYLMFQASREGTRGVRFYELGKPDWDVLRLRTLFSEARSTDGPLDVVEMDHEFPAVGRRTLLLNARRLPRGGPLEKKTLVAIQDITERKQAEEALRQKTVEAQEASLIKSRFVSNVSHELRTPLNAILGYSALLAQGVYGALSQEQMEPLSGVRRNAKDLLYLVNDVLDLARIEAGKLPVSLEPLKLDLLLREVVAGMKPFLEKKALDIQWVLPEALPLMESDAGKMKQILTNLLSNAIKFTAKGQITIAVKDRPEKKGVEVGIQDTGVGIKPEELAKIFDAFHQADADTTREFGGVGLGLTIVKELVHLLKGEMTVESEYQKGSTFTLFFPYRIS